MKYGTFKCYYSHLFSLLFAGDKQKKTKNDSYEKPPHPPPQKQNKGWHSFRGISFFFFVCDTLKSNSNAAPFVQSFLWNSDNEVPKLSHVAYMTGFSANLTTFEKVYEDFFFFPDNSSSKAAEDLETDKIYQCAHWFCIYVLLNPREFTSAGYTERMLGWANFLTRGPL